MIFSQQKIATQNLRWVRRKDTHFKDKFSYVSECIAQKGVRITKLQTDFKVCPQELARSQCKCFGLYVQKICLHVVQFPCTWTIQKSHKALHSRSQMLLAPTLPSQRLLSQTLPSQTLPPRLSHGDVSNIFQRDMAGAGKNIHRQKGSLAKSDRGKNDPPWKQYFPA